MKWTCSVCGYTHEGDKAPEKFPQCGVPAEKFPGRHDAHPARRDYQRNG